jgi:hypothetical protein
MMKTRLEPQMKADERRWIGWFGSTERLLSFLKHRARTNTIPAYLRSSAFICGSIAFAFLPNSEE